MVGTLMGGDTIVGITSSQDNRTRAIIFMGQSNTQAVSVNGSNNFYREIEQYKSTKGTVAIYCAQGGTNISQWQKGQPLYEDCIQKMKAIPNSVAWGMAYLQGENECASGAPWRGPFEQLIKDFRADTNSPNMAVAWMRIDNLAFGAGPFLNQVRFDQETANVGPLGHWVDADNLPLGPDGLHFKGSADSAEELGTRFGMTLGPLLQ